MKSKRIIPVCLIIVGIILTGCGIFPKEEELQRTPIIEAYQREEFKTAEVKKGTLQKFETIDAVCMNIGETRYYFEISNLSYNNIYVQQGEYVHAGTKLADLLVSYTDTQLADDSQAVLTAKEDSTITFVTEIEDGEKSIAGQIVVIANSRDAFYLNAYTKYWDRFNVGDEVTMHINGSDCQALVISPEEIGIESDAGKVNENGEAQVFFKVKEEGLYLKSEDVGSVTILADEKENVLYIPDYAVTTVDDKEVVYVENEDGIRVSQYVETGLRADNKVEIKSGLKEGDKVILE